MHSVSGGRSSWACALLLVSLQLWGRLSASTTSVTLPAPTLEIYSKSKDSVVLVCRAPEGNTGVLFMLYERRKKVDSRDLPSHVGEVQFTVRIQEWVPGQSKLFCCLYRSQEGHYSAFSPYLQLEDQNDTSLPPPVLSVEPSSGEVKRGDLLSFSCTVPAHPQSQSNKPTSFLLLRTAKQTGTASVIQQPRASQVSNFQLQPGVFTVGPVRGGEEGEYTCLYQMTKESGLVNSTVSNIVPITITDILPAPNLHLEQQTDVWHLLCIGSAAYPGAVFSLYLVDGEFPVATFQANIFAHQATFPLPVQDSPVALYQCQYSVRLGETWSKSEHSNPLTVTKGNSPPPTSTDSLNLDWPLVVGSLSAAVLILCSLAVVIIVVHRKVKARAEERQKREDTQFWSQVHAKDHIVDITLTRTTFPSEDWVSRDTEATSRAPLWNPLSTFTTQIH
ncbi:uncharacterized protein LOC102198585 isoform X2 [Pundamilia nyererei]|uniref:Uncharacterized protein LOC102198585 isoform X2 n=1 Tax=Pundamilia nyererei TaxID=303518 RepID=A0A9Y3RSJ5_9CICH|nr:PREDICTED: uncharacterized protein LOC102198585 isoform X2 [Pundamilia nyererei]